MIRAYWKQSSARDKFSDALQPMAWIPSRSRSRNDGRCYRLQRHRSRSRGRGDTAGFIKVLFVKDEGLIESTHYRIPDIANCSGHFPPKVMDVPAGGHTWQQVTDGVGQLVNLVNKLGLCIFDTPDIISQHAGGNWELCSGGCKEGDTPLWIIGPASFRTGVAPRAGEAATSTSSGLNQLSSWSMLSIDSTS